MGYKTWEEEQLSKHGWYAHYVPAPETGALNAHTHGLLEHCAAFKHDLQIVLDLPPNAIVRIFNSMLAKGQACAKRYGKLYPLMHQHQVLHGLSVLLIEAAEDSHVPHYRSRTVWRIILPDPAGNLSPCHIAPPYLHQYEGTNPRQVEELKRWVSG
jgi:hypothetical protein